MSTALFVTYLRLLSINLSHFIWDPYSSSEFGSVVINNGSIWSYFLFFWLKLNKIVFLGSYIFVGWFMKPGRICFIFQNYDTEGSMLIWWHLWLVFRGQSRANLGRNPGCSYWGSSWLYSFCSVSCYRCISGLDRYIFTLFTTCYSPIVVQFEATYPQMV